MERRKKGYGQMTRSLVISLLAALLLSGCVDLTVEKYHDFYYDYRQALNVMCEDNLGGEFIGIVYPQESWNGQVHHVMNLLELGMNPFADEVHCDLEDNRYDCCGEVSFPPWVEARSVTLYCGKYRCMCYGETCA